MTSESLLSKQLSRVARIPQRARRDLQLIRLLKNWRAALAAEVSGALLNRLELRNGVVLNAPDKLNLAFLFNEIWVRRVYEPRPGFEVRPGDVVVDVGANIGVFAAYAATAAPDVRVYAYEPFPGNVEWLERNVRESGLENVRVKAEAVAGARGERALHLSPSGWIFHSLVRDEASGGEDIKVSCVTLDDVFESNGIERCDLLKLDCEGSEYEILQRCTPQALGRVRRIVGEYHDGPEMGTGRELARFLESRSFRIDHFETTGEGCGFVCATNVGG